MPRETPEHGLSEPKERDVIIPRDIGFELIFRKNDAENNDKMSFEPVGEFRYFSGENRPVAPKYKLYLPEKYRNKENLRIIFEEMARYLLSKFSGWLAPETEEDFSVVLFGGYDRKTKMPNFDSFFSRLRYSLEKKGISVSVGEWENILREMDALEIDVENIFPPDDLPFNDENYKNFWQYEIFGASPPTPPHSEDETFSPPIIKIKIDDDLLKTARKNRKLLDDLMSVGEKTQPTPIKKEKRPAHLGERYQCTYGIDPAGKTMEEMSYYPEINGDNPDTIEIIPKGISYEFTASATPETPSRGWKIVFPQDTPSEAAAIFMDILQRWDGLRVLDALTVTNSQRVELAFSEAEEKFSPNDYKKFKEWARGKKVKLVESDIGKGVVYSDENLS